MEIKNERQMAYTIGIIATLGLSSLLFFIGSLFEREGMSFSLIIVIGVIAFKIIDIRKAPNFTKT